MRARLIVAGALMCCAFAVAVFAWTREADGQTRS